MDTLGLPDMFILNPWLQVYISVRPLVPMLHILNNLQQYVYDSGSDNVRIPEQNQLQAAVSNQLTTNSGNVAESPVFGSSFLNKSGLTGQLLYVPLLLQYRFL